jgi:hypothetical protein
MPSFPEGPTLRPHRIIGKARGRRLEPGIPKEWTPVIDVHPQAFRPDPLTGYAWLQFPDRIREIHRQRSATSSKAMYSGRPRGSGDGRAERFLPPG